MAALVHSTLWHMRLKFILVNLHKSSKHKKENGYLGFTFFYFLFFFLRSGFYFLTITKAELMACDTAMTFKFPVIRSKHTCEIA